MRYALSKYVLMFTASTYWMKPFANCEVCASQYWTLCIIVPCSSLGGNYIDDFILPSYLLNFLTKHKSFVSWGVDRSEHNSWNNPNTLKIFLWFGIPMRGVSGDGNEWINTWSNCCLWGEWVETARSVRRRGYRSSNERLILIWENVLSKFCLDYNTVVVFSGMYSKHIGVNFGADDRLLLWWYDIFMTIHINDYACPHEKHTKKKRLWDREGKRKMMRRCIYLPHHKNEISSHVNCLSLPYHMTFLFVYTFLVAYFCCVYILLARGNARAFY